MHLTIKTAKGFVMQGLSYKTLRDCKLKGMRNGGWRLLDKVQRSFYSVCMAYARLRGSIVNPHLVGLLRELIERIRSTPRIRALKAAMMEVDRVAPIYLKAGVFNWAPQLYRWLQDESYLIWLGLTKLNMPSIFQT